MGVDPGTTTGLAIFNLKGELLSVSSGKNYSMDRMFRHISRFGHPVIFATDKRPVPRLVEKMSSSFSAKTMFPEYEMSRKEKGEMAREFRERHFRGERVWQNSHEKDALVASLFAWSRLRNFLAKVEKRIGSRVELEKRGCLDLLKAEMLFSKDNIDKNIRKYMERCKAR